MRKFLLVPVLAFALAGCAVNPAGQSVLTGGSSFVAPINNPIGANQQYELEAAVAVVRRTGLAYMRLRQCRASETASATNLCGRRSVKVQIQDASRKLTAALNAERAFRRNNPTLNAVSVVVAVQSALAAYQNVLSSNGVTQ